MRVSAQMVAEIDRVVNFSTITSWAGGQLLDYQKRARKRYDVIVKQPGEEVTVQRHDISMPPHGQG
jgi:hypothetical protein